MNGLSLFSGYGGIDIALEDYVETILYCEIERYAQGILLSRMEDEILPFAPIWNDVATLNGAMFRGLVDIIHGGFPCQDISVAGNGKGLEGERSGLFFEIIRLTREISPSFVFLENVPAIRTRGLRQVVGAFAEVGYDCRWTCISAEAVGANHKRERWFLLAHPQVSNARLSLREEEAKSESGITGTQVAHPSNNGLMRRDQRPSEDDGERKREDTAKGYGESSDLAHAAGKGLERTDRPQQELTEPAGRSDDTDPVSERLSEGTGQDVQSQEPETVGPDTDHVCFKSHAEDSSWWAVEPDVGRVVNGLEDRAHRIKALGNGVVPLQVKTAFEILMGLR